MKLVVVVVVLLLIERSEGLENGLARTPPMGWNSWNTFACNISETLIKETAEALVNSKLNLVGYEYVNIDDCWQAPERDSQGRLQANPDKFPNGILALSEYVHELGLKLGIYSDVGLKTCQGFPGSYGHFKQDAETFASWGVDYLKFDYCYRTANETSDPAPYYQEMSDALLKTERPIVFSICEWGWKKPWEWAPAIGNLWRTHQDIFPNWPWIVNIIDEQNRLAAFAGPGGWNDPDILEVGVDGHFFNSPQLPKTSLTQTESNTHFAFWSILAAPLLLGNDVRNSPSWVNEIVGNEEIVAVNQDPLGKAGFRVAQNRSTHLHTEVWSRPLSNNRVAALLFNAAELYDEADPNYSSENITMHWTDLQLPPTQKMRLRDLHAHSDLGVFSFSFTSPPVPPHGNFFISLTPLP